MSFPDPLSVPSFYSRTCLHSHNCSICVLRICICRLPHCAHSHTGKSTEITNLYIQYISIFIDIFVYFSFHLFCVVEFKAKQASSLGNFHRIALKTRFDYSSEYTHMATHEYFVISYNIYAYLFICLWLPPRLRARRPSAKRDTRRTSRQSSFDLCRFINTDDRRP